jgi:ABC-type nitrate/sulfonate/bicarbonate transport system substrate-binding protein
VEVDAVHAPLEPELYERLIDRLRHAAQYAQAAQKSAEELRFQVGAGDPDVSAMSVEAVRDRERVLSQLQHVQHYADAAALAVQDAMALLEHDS